MIERPPSDFDWVTARTACAAEPLFERVREQALMEQDRFGVHITDDRNFAVWDAKPEGRERRAADFQVTRTS